MLALVRWVAPWHQKDHRHREAIISVGIRLIRGISLTKRRDTTTTGASSSRAAKTASISQTFFTPVRATDTI